MHGEIGKADGQQRAGRHINQLHLGIGAFIAQDVDVALHEFTQAALLRALGTVHPVCLDDLERRGELLPVGRVVSRERQCQIVPQAHVGKLFFAAGGQRLFQLVAALEHLEDQVQVVAAVAFVQVLHVFHNGRGNAFEARGAVGL